MSAALLFLVIMIPDAAAANAACGPLADVARRHGGTVLACAMPERVEPLETGTAREAVFIARWPEREAFDRYWADVAQARAAIERVTGSRAFLIRGFPAEGLPGAALPTVATVQPPDTHAPPAYMLIQGTVTDREAMQAYSGIIVPMLRERGAYYLAQARTPDVTVLFGEWREQAFLISRWPTAAAARDFWYSERYQKTAIPTRAHAGHFRVVLVPGPDG